MSEADVLNGRFREAVAAIDAGDVATLERLLDDRPTLVSDRLEKPGAWLRDRVGGALNGFFGRPYLLWFVAEDPVRNGRLPQNITAVIRTIVDAARQQGASSLQEQLDYTLRLVSWSWIAAKCGVQLDMIDTLVEAGASPRGEPNNALVNGHFAAAERLLAHGAPVTFAAALCLERWDDVDRMLPDTNPGQRQFAFVLAALNGKAKALERMIASGIDVNKPSGDLYSHGTPLHHAVCSGSLESVRVLVDAGANLDAADTAWRGTPRGWALHYVEEAGSDAERHARYAAIASFLGERSA